MSTFTIVEIKNYLLQQDSIGDILYNLSEENIRKANKTISFTYQEIFDSGNWDKFCEKYQINEWAVKEGGGDENDGEWIAKVRGRIKKEDETNARLIKESSAMYNFLLPIKELLNNGSNVTITAGSNAHKDLQAILNRIGNK